MGKLRKFKAEFADRWKRLTGRTPQVLARDAGSKVGEIRKASKMTAKEIAEKVGVSERTVKAWEKGKREPRGKTAERLNEVMTDSLVKRQKLREERAAKQGKTVQPQAPAPRGITITGSVQIGQGRTRPHRSYNVESGQKKVTDRDIARVVAAGDSGVPGLIDAEAGRVIALAWGIPEDDSDYTVAFPGGASIH